MRVQGPGACRPEFYTLVQLLKCITFAVHTLLQYYMRMSQYQGKLGQVLCDTSWHYQDCSLCSA